jgi:hypothetical protein
MKKSPNPKALTLNLKKTKNWNLNLKLKKNLIVYKSILILYIKKIQNPSGLGQGTVFFEKNTPSSNFVGLDERSPKQVLHYLGKFRG